jgi:uncharacterized protein YceK
MKKLFDIIRKELTNYSFETKGWSFVLILMLILIVLSSCSTIEVQDTRDMEEFEEHYKSCDQWVTVSSEAWMQCMMDRIDINTTTSGNTATNTYQPITIWSSVGT